MRSTAPSTRPGMGAVPHSDGTSFRVWAPHATAVFVTGTFDDWAGDADRSRPRWRWHERDVVGGCRRRRTRRRVPLHDPHPDGDLSRIDPYARQVTNSVGNAIVYDPDAFDWGGDTFQMPSWDDLVIYEMHVGTFAPTGDRAGTFDDARRRLDYLEDLGVSAVQVMPPFEFAGDISWGYNPAHLFAIESSYGGPDGFKSFIRAAHAKGIGVIVDVVYNHIGPSDLDLWRFDGWAEDGGGGGIYLYNDDRALTPWGATRPDYGRGEVRTFLRDSALTWLEEFRCDGLRFDSTVFVRSVDGHPRDPRSVALPDGWSFLSWVTDEIRARQPWKITIAEDLEDDPLLTTPTDDGGAGFDAQWDAGFIRRIRPQLETNDDAERDMAAVAAGILGDGRGAPLNRVIYTESHDEVANGLVRVPEAISPGDAGDWFARKRALLGLGTRAHLARHPDALPGPGAARGPVLRRHGPARLGQGRDVPRDRGRCTATSSPFVVPATAPRAACAARTSRSCVPTRSRSSSSCIAGWMAGRTTTRSSSRTSRTGPSMVSPRVPRAWSLGGPLQLRRDLLRRRLRQPRRVRPRRRRSTARRLRPERRRLARAVQRGDLLARGLTEPGSSGASRVSQDAANSTRDAS